MTTLVKTDGVSVSQLAWKQVQDVFRKGGLVAYPTETFYGLGVDPFNKTAVKKLFTLKGREADKPISILVKDKNMLAEIAEEIPSAAEKLIKKFWPGPLTIIFNARKSIHEILTAGTGKVGVRISSNPVTQKLLEAIDSPITTTSANPSGKKSPLTAREVTDYFGDKVDLIIDGGKLYGKLGSTIVDVTEGDLKVIREGELPVTVIRDQLSTVRTKHKTKNN
ncbi:MAG: threonylcarbamoyl-AMP synthase [Deltaproteobacteria bacterium]|nr:threonylcarbamoyl-AMP synthase [Deltaproteobacteria bacterium]